MHGTLLSGAFLMLLAMAGRTANFGIDLSGKPIEKLTQSDTQVVVLFFASSDCPISNRYIPEITRIQREFSARKVAFWWVFPNPGDTAVVVREHERVFSIGGATVLDREQRLVQLAHVTATPETAVFRVSEGDLVELYRGRVDDRYISLGKERPNATEHFLEDAIADALAGRAVAHSITNPVGCSIVPLAAVK